MSSASVVARHLLLAALLGLCSVACQTAAPAVAAVSAIAPVSPEAPAARTSSHDSKEPSGSSDAEQDPLKALNALFHQQYASARAAYVARLGTGERPVLLMDGTLTLSWQGKTTRYPVFTSRYHTLKALSHVPFSVYAGLLGNVGPEFSEETKERFRNTRELIPAVLAALDDPASTTRRDVPPELLDGARTLLRESDTLLAECLSRGRPTPERLSRFVQAVRPVLIAHVRAAARDELDQLHQHVRTIRSTMPPAQWERVVVVISVVRQARAREGSLQYFERLLGEPPTGEGASREGRIVVLEAFGSREPLEVMGVHELDRDSAAGLLGDPLLLQSDLLAPYAAEYLKQLLP
ncbi:hypothetical protein [Vitiosangium sp. GDMCC 1.1324]|uniref:hypothetical protein n=1 Tax=Vitiosangium sp. (strain GDMCC 1.1324) TaxID=2138576 RepID=UPI000D3475C1|nr:hypothetical protein [Vitiosangium sp. GDMCC 1.1324]PTL75294.1 hypothetical protein DAT35_55655 [Vitiosangium sp. GDMCC 1.1324]